MRDFLSFYGKVTLTVQLFFRRYVCKPSTAWLATLIWCTAISLGWLALANYGQRPGVLYAPPEYWPQTTALVNNSLAGRLLVFIHPHCPCTRASLTELDRLLARHPGVFHCSVVLVKPPGTSAEWHASQLMQIIASIPHVDMVIDQDAVEAGRFQAETSGVAMLYDLRGKLVFHGGLTSARGHEGDSLGLRVLQDFARGQSPTIDRSAVFGCPLNTPLPQRKSVHPAVTLLNSEQGHRCCQNN